jgi:hypothetical protein
MWNMRRRHSSHNWSTPAAERQSRPHVLCAPPQRSKSLYGRRSGGYAASAAPAMPVSTSTLCFQQVNAAATSRLRTASGWRAFFPLAACFQQVPAQQPVNTSVFTANACRPLIPLWFPHSNLKFLYSSHSGVTCPLNPMPKAACSWDAGQGEDFRLPPRPWTYL